MKMLHYAVDGAALQLPRKMDNLGRQREAAETFCHALQAHPENPSHASWLGVGPAPVEERHLAHRRAERGRPCSASPSRSRSPSQSGR